MTCSASGAAAATVERIFFRIVRIRRGNAAMYSSIVRGAVDADGMGRHGSGNEWTGPVDGALRDRCADHQRAGVVLLLADVLEELRPFFPPKIEPSGERLRVCVWIVDGH